MENLNNIEEVIEVMEPVEILEETTETMESLDSKNLAIGAAIIAGVIAGGYGLKKLWDKRKSKRTASEVVEVIEKVENKPDETEVEINETKDSEEE